MTRFLIGIFAVFMVVAGAGALRTPAALAGSGGCNSPYTDGSGTRVEMQLNCFFPTVLHVPEGTTVEFVNGDDWEHMVTGAALSWGDYGRVVPGQIVMQTFVEPGVYVYACAVHSGMTGAIVVGDGSGAGPAAAASVPIDGGAAPADEEAQRGKAQISNLFGSSDAGLMAVAVVAGAAVTAGVMRRRGG